MNRSFKLEPLESRQLLNAGGLDQSFGDAGLLPISRGVTVSNVFSLADGRLIVAGRNSETADGAGRPYLLRLTATGAVDSTYPSTPLVQNFRFADNIDQFAIDGQERILISRQTHRMSSRRSPVSPPQAKSTRALAAADPSSCR